MLSMHEIALKNKKTASNDKWTIYELSTLVVTLLETLISDSILSEEDCFDLSNRLIEAQSKKLLLLPKVDYTDLDLSKKEQGSWFKITSTKLQKKNLMRTSLPFFKSFHADGMESKSKLTKIRKIKLKLTSIQRKILVSWSHSARYSYNKAVWFINDSTSYYSKIDLRNLIVPEHVNQHIPWILETPKSIREASVFEAKKNLKACITNLQNGNINRFQLKFLSRKKKSFTLGGFQIKKITNKSFETFERCGLGHIKTCEDILDSSMTCSIHFDGANFYLLQPFEVQCKQKLDSENFVSFDPGVRTFLTGYDPQDYSFVKIGDGASSDLLEKAKKIDSNISLLKKARRSKSYTKKRNKEIKKKIKKQRIKIQNMQKELHDKTARAVCDKYKNIVLPVFGTSDMSRRTNTTISKTVKRRMLLLGHGKFLEKLKTKAKEVGCALYVVSEAFTTKTCGNCAFRNPNVGRQSEWTCPVCQFVHDRDANASRNILTFNYREMQPYQI
jgi:putative transposase